MNDKQVFLYRPTAKLSLGDLAALREAGFIPIKVQRFDDVRLIDPMMTHNRTAVWMAAMEAIANTTPNSEGVKTMFGRLVAEKLADTSVPQVLK